MRAGLICWWIWCCFTSGSVFPLLTGSYDQVVFVLCIVCVEVATRLCLFYPWSEWEWKLLPVVFVSYVVPYMCWVGCSCSWFCCAFAFLGSARQLLLSPSNTSSAHAAMHGCYTEKATKARHMPPCTSFGLTYIISVHRSVPRAR